MQTVNNYNKDKIIVYLKEKFDKLINLLNTSRVPLIYEL